MQSKHNKQLVPLARQLRKEMTKEERHLWYDFLRKHPGRFSRQKIFGRYIVDFYSAKARLIIELDGSQHYEAGNMEKDAERTAFLEGYGLTVIRIPNNAVNQNFRGVCEYIDAAVEQSLSQKSDDCGDNRLRAVRSAALTVHRTVIHYRRLRFAYPLHKGAYNPSVTCDDLSLSLRGAKRRGNLMYAPVTGDCHGR